MTSAVQRRCPNLSLVIATLNEGEELHETVRSVLAASLVPAETIIVDDGSTDSSSDVLRGQAWRAQGVVVHRIERSGIAAARNHGAALASGSHLVFLDAHCRLDTHCLATLAAALAARPGAILAPAICDFGSTTFGCGARLIDAALRIRWLPPAGAPMAVPIAPGGCFALSRVIFERLNGFAAFRELGLEDVELSLRAWRLGIEILAMPAAKLSHRFRQTPPYRLSSASRAYNVARVALIHFDAPRREECLRTVIGTPRAAEVLVDAFASDWEGRRREIADVGGPTMESYFGRFGDWR